MIQTPLSIQPYRGEIVVGLKYLPSHMVITRKFKQNSDPASLMKAKLAPFPEEGEFLENFRNWSSDSQTHINTLRNVQNI